MDVCMVISHQYVNIVGAYLVPHIDYFNNMKCFQTYSNSTIDTLNFAESPRACMFIDYDHAHTF